MAHLGYSDCTDGESESSAGALAKVKEAIGISTQGDRSSELCYLPRVRTHVFGLYVTHFSLESCE